MKKFHETMVHKNKLRNMSKENIITLDCYANEYCIYRIFAYHTENFPTIKNIHIITLTLHGDTEPVQSLVCLK